VRVVYFKLLSENSPGRTEKNFESGWSKHGSVPTKQELQTSLSQACHRVGPTGNKHNNINNLMYTITILKNVIFSRKFLCRCKAVRISQIKVLCSVRTADLTYVLLQDFVFLLSIIRTLSDLYIRVPASVIK
jgi:hypothetical protein